MDLLQLPTQMTWTDNIEENLITWFQKFELSLIASEKTTKPDHVKCLLFLHIAEKKAIEVNNTLTFPQVEKNNCNALVHKFTKFAVSKKDLAYERYIFNDRD